MTLENEGTNVPATDTAAPSDTPATPETQEAPDWDTAVDSDLKAIFQKHNPERDEAGKFAGKEAPATETQDQAPEQVMEQAPPAIQPPNSWSADVKAEWAKLPPAVQEYVAKRESEAHEKITQQGQELSQLTPIRSLIEQNMDVFERNNLTPDDGLARLLSAERLLEQNPVAAIEQIASAYGVNLAMFAPAANQSEAALRNHIAQLEARLNETSNSIREREWREAQTTQKQTLSEIERFASDKSDWPELENDILTEITGIRANIDAGLMQPLTTQQILEKAYERAQRNNPQVWQKKQDEERKAAEAKKVEEARKRADEAKRANVVNIKSPVVSGKTINTMDDDLVAAFRKANSK